MSTFSQSQVMPQRLTIKSAFLLCAIATVGCADPVGDKPRAAVADAVPAPAADVSAAAEDVFPILGEGSTVAFTGAKVTGIHE